MPNSMDSGATPAVFPLDLVFFHFILYSGFFYEWAECICVIVSVVETFWFSAIVIC